MLNPVSSIKSKLAAPPIPIVSVLDKIGVQNTSSLMGVFESYAKTRSSDSLRKLGIEFARVFPNNINDATSAFDEIVKESSSYIYPEEVDEAKTMIKRTINKTA